MLFYEISNGGGMESVKALLVDDDAHYLQTSAQLLGALGVVSTKASSCREGLRVALADEPDIIFLDLRLPDGDGVSLMRQLQEAGQNAPIVLISGSATIPDAVAALKQGAVDFLVKPVGLRELEAALRRALEMGRLRSENLRLRELIRENSTDFIGEDSTIKELLQIADKVAASDLPILIEGETGVGKQVLARHIVAQSDRSREPLVAVNCAAIVSTLFESELFGHEKGAFTGAAGRKIGKLELAGRGTLFLDEIGELPLPVQAKMLTALEDRVFERVGGGRSIRFEGRIIAATNRDLNKDLAAGLFRRDLFYRLSGLRLHIPALREHPEDIPLFIQRGLENAHQRYNRKVAPPHGEVLAKLQQHSWPGNVRELMHHVERVVLLSSGEVASKSLWLAGIDESARSISHDDDDLRIAVDNFKARHIDRILNECGGNQTAAAVRLGVGRSYLNQIVNKEK